MRLRVLGSAAGGGLPQWNCGCTNCAEARRPTGRIKTRTQDSIALLGEHGGWFLINASPDIHRQIQGFRDLAPVSGRRTPIEGVVLTNGDLDHTLGLFSLRESTPLVVYATEPVWHGLSAGNVIFRTLQRFEGQLTFRKLELGHEIELQGRDGEPTGLRLRPWSAPGKVPKHLEGLAPPSPEDNVGLSITDALTRRRVEIATAVGAPGPYLDDLEGAEACFFDGTFWSSDELIRLGLGTARAEDMAHWPIGGPDGSLAVLAARATGRVIYQHLNNTNPVLFPGSPERRAVELADFSVAEDGLELIL